MVPSYTTFDLGVAQDLRIAGLPATARLTATNMFSRRYIASTGSNTLAMGMPATLRFSVEAGF